MKRRAFFKASAALVGGIGLPPLLHAQGSYPSKPIRLIIPSAPGGSLDVVGRLYGEKMARLLKQPVVPDNVSGAGTLLAMRQALAAQPDGYTLLIAANTLVTLPYVDKGAGYSPSDFTGISSFSRTPMMLLVSASSPYNTLGDLIAAAKKAPGIITFASLGIGTTTHLPAEMFAQAAGIKLQLIPYKASPLALPDVVSERVNFILGSTSTASEMVKAGKLRALAITSDTRSPAFPNVPTFAEHGLKEVSYFQWLALFGSAKMPANVRALLADVANEVKKDPDLLKRLEAQGSEIGESGSAEQFNVFLRHEEERMKKVVKEANIDTTGK